MALMPCSTLTCWRCSLHLSKAKIRAAEITARHKRLLDDPPLDKLRCMDGDGRFLLQIRHRCTEEDLLPSPSPSSSPGSPSIMTSAESWEHYL